MKFTNLTRHVEIGANSYFIEIGGHRLVLDSGMHPKEMGENALPNFKPIADRTIDAIIISHAHQDHIGTLPVLMHRQPDARVFMTEATAEIGDTLLHNSVNVMTRQREELGAMLYPLFTHRGVDRAANFWRSCPMRQCISISGERASPSDVKGLTFEFFDAGHVLGSAGVLLRAEGRAVFYTGDVNFDDQTIMQAAVFPEEKIDILIMECTRGDHAQPAEWTRSGEERRLGEAIEKAFSRGGGCVLIPVFALGENAGSTGDALQIPARRIAARLPDLYRRSQLENDCDLRSPCSHRPETTPAFAAVGYSRPVRFEWRNDS